MDQIPLGGKQMSDRKVTCLITGQSVLMGKDYFSKKAEEYGGEDNLRKYYISKKAKSLVRRGYGVNEIRKILNITETLLDEDNEDVRGVVQYHSSEKQTISSKRLESAQNFMMQTSDEDVAIFINNIKSLNL
jgi:hypothetical protein